MNKKLFIGLALAALVLLGYFALKTDTQKVPTHDESMHSMEGMSESGLELIQENIDVSFNKFYSINDDWKIKVIQFEPNAKINGPALIVSDSNEELNPAAKINFYKNDELIHYQICFRDMPGFHSVKEGQEYLIDLMKYDGFKVLGNGEYTVDSINIKVWRIK